LLVSISEVNIATMQITIIIAYLKATLATKAINAIIIDIATITAIIIGIRITNALLVIVLKLYLRGLSNLS